MPFAFWLLLALSHLSLLAVHFSWMWTQESYHYLPALAIAICLLFAYRWDKVLRLPSSWQGWALIAISACAILPVAVWSNSPWLTALAFILNLGAFLLSQKVSADDARDGQLFRVWPLTWLLVPLPMNMDQTLTAVLQLRSSRLSSYLLDLLNVPHVLLGNVIELPSERLFVEEACSGVQSLYTVVFCAVLIVVAFGRAMCLLPVYVALAIVWAVLMNVIRIVAIAAVRHWYDLDWSHGWQHSAIGYVSLSVSVLLLLSSDRVIRVLFFPTKPAAGTRGRTNPLVTTWNYLFWSAPRPVRLAQAEPAGRPRLATQALMAMAICILLWQSVQAVNRPTSPEPVSEALKQRFMNMPHSIPSSSVQSFVQASHERLQGSIEMPLGENADVWRGSIATIPATIALTQPYPTWHDLSGCYRAIGWQLNDRENLVTTGSDGQEWDYTFTRWVTDSGAYGYVWYCGFDERGRYVECAERSLLSRWRFRAIRDKSVTHGRVAMVQLVVESESALPGEVMNMMAKAFLESREFLMSAAESVAPK